MIVFEEGQLQEADEVVLLIKTDRERYQQLERRIRELHSYSVPEILAVPSRWASQPTWRG